MRREFLLVAVLGTGLATACAGTPAIADVLTAQKEQNPDARMCICTAQYDPVCARTSDGKATTYSNACRARCDKAVVIRKGTC